MRCLDHLEHQRTGLECAAFILSPEYGVAALLYLGLRGINFTAIQSRLSQINVGWIALAG